MKLEWFGYQPLAPGKSTMTVRPTLPEHIQKELIDDPPLFQGLICVDKSKADVIRELDQIFHIGKKRDFHKYANLEADQTEIDDYSHFFIGPTRLESGKDVFFEWTGPVCRSPACAWGAGIRPPVKMNAARTKKLALGVILPSPGMEVDLVVSSEIRDLFAAEEVSGLDYEPCGLVSEGERVETTGGGYFQARITHTASQGGSYIRPGDYCRKHMTVTAPLVFDRRLLLDSMPDTDFLTINRVAVGRREYYYNVPSWIVSRKVLRLLLDHRVPGLRTITVRLKQEFRPVLYCE